MNYHESPEAPAISPTGSVRARRRLLAAALVLGLMPVVLALGAASYAATTGPSVTAWSDQIVLSHSGTSVTMQYSGVDTDVARFSCSLDAQVKDCSGPSLALTNLADNATHSFSIRGYDAAGHAGPLFVLKWVVGESFPDTEIVSGPAEGSVTGSWALFYWSSPNASTVGVRCWIDRVEANCWGSSGAWFPYLTDGTHTVAFAAVDDQGRQDPTPATRTWIVDHRYTNSQ
jgi:hypothetical protein